MKEITKALIIFHNEVGVVSKNSTNPYFKSKYGDLNSYLAVIKEPLQKASLSFTQVMIPNGLKTIVSHTSGEVVESEFSSDNLPGDVQKLGAWFTYMRRYQLSAILGLNAEDNDGNDAVPPKQSKAQIEKDRLELVEKARMCFKAIKEPSEALNTWISTVDTLDNVSIVKGLNKIQKITQEQK